MLYILCLSTFYPMTEPQLQIARQASGHIFRKTNKNPLMIYFQNEMITRCAKPQPHQESYYKQAIRITPYIANTETVKCKIGKSIPPFLASRLDLNLPSY